MKEKRFLSLLLSLCLVAVMLPAGALAMEPDRKPNYTVLTLPEDETQSGGITQTAYWPSYAARLPSRTGLYAAEVPATYDLRTMGRSTTVKNQSPWGSCWAFGALSSLESNILASQSASGSAEAANPDYSEHQLAWFAYEKQTADSLAGSEAGANQAGEGAWTTTVDQLDAGGNMPQAAALLSTWQGAALEADIPYQNAGGSTSSSGNWSLPAAKRNESAVHLTDADFLPNPATFSQYDEYEMPTADATYQFDEEAAKAIKRAIMEHGTVAIAYYADQSRPGQSGDATYFNYTNYCQFVNKLDSSTLPNHGVSIVGWDDNYPSTNFNAGKQPEGNGAWLVKNSWGTGWGLEGTGYFYLSYYDRTIQQVTSFQGETEPSYDHNYQYDYLGLASGAFYNAMDTETSVANVFQSNGNEELLAVSAVTATPGAAVTVKVYRLNENPTGPYDGTLAATVSKTIPYAGYHTLELGTPVPLAEGESFSVVESIQAGGKYELPVEIGIDGSSSNKQTAIRNAGESYLINPTNPSGVDFTSPDSGLSGGDGASVGNAMIKAFTVDAGREEAPELTGLSYEAFDKNNVSLVAQTISEIAEPGIANIELPGPTAYLKLTGVTLSDGADANQVTFGIDGTAYALNEAIPRAALAVTSEKPLVATTHSTPLGTAVKSYEFDFLLLSTILAPDRTGVMVTDDNAYLPSGTALSVSEVGRGGEYDKIAAALAPLGGADQFYVLDLSFSPALTLGTGETVNLAVTKKSGYPSGANTVLLAADVSGANATLRQVADDSENTGTLRADVDKLGYYVVAVVKAAPPLPGLPSVTYSQEQTLENISLPAVYGGTWMWSDDSVVPTVAVKTYSATFTASQDGPYRSYIAEIPLTVKKAAPALNVFTQTNVDFTYGMNLSDCTFTATAKESSGTAVPGSAVWKDGSVNPKVSDSGTTLYEIQFTPADSANYETAVFTSTVTVKKAPVTVTPVSVSRVYGDENPEFAYTITGGRLFFDDTKADLAVALSSSADKTASVGTAGISGTSSSANYQVTVNPGTLTITARPLHVKVKNVSVPYGQPIPAFEAEVTNLVNDDELASVGVSLSYTTEAVSGSLAGDYEVSVKLADSSVTNTNYRLSADELEPGTLTIQPVKAGTENHSTTISNETAALFEAWGSLSDTDTLVIDDQENAEAAEAFIGMVGGNQKTGLTFDASLTGELKGPLALDIPVGASYNGKKVTVLHYVKEGKKSADGTTAASDTVDSYGELTVSNGKVSVWVYSLSPFAVLLPKETSSGGTPPSGPTEPTVTTNQGGKAQVSGSTVTITPDEGYEVGSIEVNGKQVSVPENGVLTGLQPGDVVEITFVTAWKNPFTDVAKGSWYYSFVRYAYENDLFLGVTDTTFEPGSAMTREMLAAVLWRAAGRPEGAPAAGFTDVAKGSYYEKAVNWAKEKGIVYGVSETEFGVGTPVSRQDIASMLWRWEGKPISRESLAEFQDIGEISDYAMPAIRWAVEQNVVSGKGGGILDPRGNATRAEVASMLNRYLK